VAGCTLWSYVPKQYSKPVGYHLNDYRRIKMLKVTPLLITPQTFPLSSHNFFLFFQPDTPAAESKASATTTTTAAAAANPPVQTNVTKPPPKEKKDIYLKVEHTCEFFDKDLKYLKSQIRRAAKADQSCAFGNLISLFETKSNQLSKLPAVIILTHHSPVLGYGSSNPEFWSSTERNAFGYRKSLLQFNLLILNTIPHQIRSNSPTRPPRCCLDLRSAPLPSFSPPLTLISL